MNQEQFITTNLLSIMPAGVPKRDSYFRAKLLIPTREDVKKYTHSDIFDTTEFFGDRFNSGPILAIKDPSTNETLAKDGNNRLGWLYGIAGDIIVRVPKIQNSNAEFYHEIREKAIILGMYTFVDFFNIAESGRFYTTEWNLFL